MSERIFENNIIFEVSSKGQEVELCVLTDECDLLITIRNEGGFDSQYANFTTTAEEATAMKNFLIKQGY